MADSHLGPDHCDLGATKRWGGESLGSAVLRPGPTRFDRTGSPLCWYSYVQHDDVVVLFDEEKGHRDKCGSDGEDAGSAAAFGQQRPGRLGFDRCLVQEAIELANLRPGCELVSVLGPPSVDVAENGGFNQEHGLQPRRGGPRLAHFWYSGSMEFHWVSASEWRQMSEEEQQAMIRAGITEVEDLPEDFRREVEDMVAQHSSLRRSA